jgi:hypothetical protein
MPDLRLMASAGTAVQVSLGINHYLNLKCVLHFFLVILGFELRASCLIGRLCHTISLFLSFFLFFALVIFQVEFHGFLPSWSWTTVFLSMPPSYLGPQMWPPHLACSWRWGLTNFLPWTTILLISASPEVVSQAWATISRIYKFL